MSRSASSAVAARPLRVFVVAGEHSGDALGAKLMAAIKARTARPVVFQGVGGEHMAAEGLVPLFPLGEVAVMGPLNILKGLPRLVSRVFDTVDAAFDADPDIVVIIDSPEFTHPIARRIRGMRPDIPIVDYVSPSVWAWRPGRARKMKRYVDHVLALLPFEPDAHQRLGGPACTYVGHPLVERLPWIDALEPRVLAERLGLDPKKPVLVVLPGSRSNEVGRLMQPFGETLRRLSDSGVTPEVIVPVVASVRHLVEKGLAAWRLPPSVRVHFVTGEEDKFRAFRLARAALAASGTVALELALARTPMVIAYRVDPLAAQLRFLLKAPSVVLANLVLGENAFPELLQDDCVPERLAPAVAALLREGPKREAQLAALARIRTIMMGGIASPSAAAADVVLAEAARRKLT